MLGGIASSLCKSPNIYIYTMSLDRCSLQIIKDLKLRMISTLDEQICCAE